MICPIMSKIESPVFNSEGMRVSEPGITSAECVGGKCAWWDQGDGGCSVGSLPRVLERLTIAAETLT